MDRMTMISAFFCMLTCFCAQAQDSTGTICGLIRDCDGNSIEYVSVGIPGTGIGTVSDSCGRFSLYLPPEYMQDSIIFMHVSYRKLSLPASMLLDGNGMATITLAGNELCEAVIRPAGTHRRRLVKRGMRIAGGTGVMSAGSLGHEVGTSVTVKKRFRVDRISFTVLSNAIPGCVLGVNIYRTDTAVFKNILTEPIYCMIPVSVNSSEYVIEPRQDITLEPGRYFIALALVDATLQDGQTSEDDGGKLPRLEFPLYLRPSWTRDKAVQVPEPSGVNIGLVVEGTQ